MKNRLLAILVVFSLIFALGGCAANNNSVEEKHTDGAETEVQDLYPSVPDELEKSFFLYSKNRGTCKALVGKVHILAVLVDDGESIWDEDSAGELSETLSEMMGTLVSAAEEYSTELEINGSFTRISTEEELEWDEDKEWRDPAISAAGYENMEKAGDLIAEEFDADIGVVMFCFNKSGRSYAEASSEPDGVEYAVIYEHDVSTYMHEFLHLFGTMDYYYPDEIMTVAEKYFSGTIMATGTKPVVDSLSAFVVGWTDELSEDGEKFLRETIKYTYEDAEDAGETETYTGNVKDRPLYNHDSNGKRYELGLYSGYLVDGVPNGEGVLRYSNGDVYTGEFEYGLLTGEGEMVFANGDVRRGTWNKGVLEGYGVDECANGFSYNGEFSAGVYHGDGVMVDEKGNRYDGEWVNGKFHGEGTYTWVSGAVYVGEFENGSLTGYGKYTDENGRVLKGYFEDWSYIG